MLARIRHYKSVEKEGYYIHILGYGFPDTSRRQFSNSVYNVRTFKKIMFWSFKFDIHEHCLVDSYEEAMNVINILRKLKKKPKGKHKTEKWFWI